RYRSSLITDARIEHRVQQIDEQVDADERGGDQEHAALHQRVVAGLDGADHPEPRPGHENTVSVRMAPPSSVPTWIPSTVTTGFTAFLSTWRPTTARSARPLARAERTKSWRTISSTLERVMRASAAAEAVPSVTAGS